MKLSIQRTGGIVGGMHCSLAPDELTGEQRRLLDLLFERAPAAALPPPDNRPRYRLREEREDGSVREVELEEPDMPDLLLPLTRPR